MLIRSSLYVWFIFSLISVCSYTFLGIATWNTVDMNPIRFIGLFGFHLLGLFSYPIYKATK